MKVGGGADEVRARGADCRAGADAANRKSDTVDPWKVSTPLPPDAPKMKPALTIWSEIEPVAASAGGKNAAVARRPR